MLSFFITREYAALYFTERELHVVTRIVGRGPTALEPVASGCTTGSSQDAGIPRLAHSREHSPCAARNAVPKVPKSRAAIGGHTDSDRVAE